MKKLNDFIIPFIGLKPGKHQFEYQIDKTFFENFDYHEFEAADIKVNVTLDKKSTLMELHFKHKGTVTVPCDLTSELYDQPVKGQFMLVVKFGDAYNADSDEMLILPHGEYQVDIAQYIYETIALSVPQKRIHPGVKDGTLESEALRKLNELSVKEIKKDQPEEQENDPRWDTLKKLLTDK